MKLNEHQFIEAAFIFEKESGNQHGKYEKEVINKSKLLYLKPLELKIIIIDGLNSGLYTNSAERCSAYWSLSKTNDKSLIPKFRNWLIVEYDQKNDIAIFQILTALDRFEEPAFHNERDSRYYDDTELNYRDAHNYLKNN